MSVKDTQGDRVTTFCGKGLPDLLPSVSFFFAVYLYLSVFPFDVENLLMWMDLIVLVHTFTYLLY